MVSEWQEMSLGEFITLQRGFDLPEAKRLAGDVPILGSFGITGSHAVARVKGPGLTVGRSGASYGTVTFCEVDFWPLNTSLYVKNFHGNDEEFAHYLLRCFDFKNFNSGSAQPSLNRNAVHPVRITVPPLDEQRRIAHLLRSLDSKVQVLAMAGSLQEQVAQTIFKSWFVDFDAVKAKAEGREPEGMDTATAALFPDKLDSLSGLPCGWFEEPISWMADTVKTSINPLRHPDEVYEHFSLPAFDEGRKPKREKGIAIKSNKLLIRSGVVLLSKLNPHIPRVWFPAINEHYRSVCSTEFVVLAPTAASSSEYIFSQLLQSNFEEEVRSLVSGTSNSHQRVDVNALMNLTLVRPSSQVVEAFTRLVQPLLRRTHLNLSMIATLTALRDTLLPRLISGKLRIPDAEKLVASVL